MKYYKLLNEQEYHNGFQYKKGLNIDTNKFDTSHICGYGIYITDEDNVGDWLIYMPNIRYIRQVFVSDINKLYEECKGKYKCHSVNLGNRYDLTKIHNLNKYIKDKNKALMWAVYNGHLEVVKYLVENGANINGNEYSMLIETSDNGYLDIVKYLVENGANINANNNQALRLATNRNNIDVVNYLKDKLNIIK